MTLHLAARSFRPSPRYTRTKGLEDPKSKALLVSPSPSGSVALGQVTGFQWNRNRAVWSCASYVLRYHRGLLARYVVVPRLWVCLPHFPRLIMGCHWYWTATLRAPDLNMFQRLVSPTKQNRLARPALSCFVKNVLKKVTPVQSE